MTAEPISPQVELRFNPTELRPRDLPRAGDFLGSPAEALEAALAVTRAAVVRQMRTEVKGLAEPTRFQLIRLADLAWQAAFWRYRKISAPVLADAYLRAYQRAAAGDVPASVVYDLADKHAEKVGEYFHESSREALAEGFTRLVNRQVPAKEAASRVLDAYGLTPRQMRSYTGATQFWTPVSDVLPRPVKAKARDYIDKSFTTRTKKLAEQEEHNITEQAKQFAWMWLQDKGKLNEKAQKIWITAHDERVCSICGPLNGQKVGINERFVTKQGEFWTPGLHPNCRCEVRLIENAFAKNAFGISKDLGGTALAEFNREHPRADHGRFGTKARTKTIDVDEEFRRIVSQPTQAPVRHVSYAPPRVAEAKPDTATDQAFAQLVAAQPKSRRQLGSALDSALEARVGQELALQQDRIVDLAANLVVQSHQRLALQPTVMRGMKTPTIGLTQPAYALLDYWDLDNGQIQSLKLNHGIVWSTNEYQVSQDAATDVAHHAILRKEDMLSHPRVAIYDKTTGQYIHADISAKLAGNVVDYFANTAHREFLGDAEDTEWTDAMGDQKVALHWYDERGRTVSPDILRRTGVEFVPYSWIGHQYEFREPDFMKIRVQIDQVPVDAEHEQIEGDAHSRQQSFSLNNTEYTMVPGSVEEIPGDDPDNPYKVLNVRMEPKGSVELPEQTILGGEYPSE